MNKINLILMNLGIFMVLVGLLAYYFNKRISIINKTLNDIINLLNQSVPPEEQIVEIPKSSTWQPDQKVEFLTPPTKEEMIEMDRPSYMKKLLSKIKKDESNR